MRISNLDIQELTKTIIQAVPKQLDSNTRLVNLLDTILPVCIQYQNVPGTTQVKAMVYVADKAIATLNFSDMEPDTVLDECAGYLGPLTTQLSQLIYDAVWANFDIPGLCKKLYSKGNASARLPNGMSVRSEVRYSKFGDRSFTLSDDEGPLFSNIIYVSGLPDVVNNIQRRLEHLAGFSTITQPVDFEPEWIKP